MIDFPDFNSIKSWYNAQLWTKSMVSDGVVCNKITAGQYKEIVGEDYTAPVS